MKKHDTWLFGILAAALFGFTATRMISADSTGDSVMDRQLLIDDFSSDKSNLGTSWEGFTDRVMGGISDMQVRKASEEGRPFLRMSGKVSLKNNGGFIQVRLPLREPGKSSYDGSKHTGLRIIARGSGDGYYIFLRTAGNVFPWSFYMAPLSVGIDWSEILIPWTAFGRGDFGAVFDLNVKRLTSLAVVAYKKEFDASIDVREMAFY